MRTNSDFSCVCTRRGFLRSAAALAAFPAVVPACALGADGRPPASDRIGAAVIGLGSRGGNHASSLLGTRETQLVAVCDVYRERAEEWKANADRQYGGVGCFATQDCGEVLWRPDVDVVFIAAPENWHALMSVGALHAGKDVYCEKALSLTVKEGRAVCDAVRRYGRVFQTGTQQRSDRNFRFACELARKGYLGEVHTVHVSVPGGRTLPVAVPKPPPANLNYELWLGPALWTPYNDDKCTYNWYFIKDYCAGWIQSWGVHHIDIALWGQPALMRSTLRVEGTAEFPTEGQANTSLTWNVTATPEKGPKLLFTEHKYREHGVRFIGDKGWVHVVRGGIQAQPANLLDVVLKPKDERLYESYDHQADFLACVKSRRDPVSHVESGHAATTLTLVADIATRLGRAVTWDWRAEKFVGDEAADRLLGRAMRTPWTL